VPVVRLTLWILDRGTGPHPATERQTSTA